jgi:cystathionine beta-lyase/cystathionine gamma-synthase
MNCVTSTYDASGKLVGCTEQELTSLISLQMYTMFALGTGLYLYKTFTSENWVDIAVTIGWGCVSTFTHTKRVVTKYVLPVAKFGVQTTFVSQTDMAEWKQAIQPNTRLLFAETPTNPLTEVCDIRALADIAHAANAVLAFP